MGALGALGDPSALALAPADAILLAVAAAATAASAAAAALFWSLDPAPSLECVRPAPAGVTGLGCRAPEGAGSLPTPPTGSRMAAACGGAADADVS